ncbi:MAG: NAAT family transporter [Spirochaetales bacterium]|nr:NAAT family transporter [Spirochaetales bacterium]
MNIYTAAVTLILIMDPFGNIPIFMSALKKFDEKKRRRIILRESLIAFLILTFFLFFGKFILQGLHISQPALNISGGIILFVIAIDMIFPGKGKASAEEVDGDPVIVPLAVPLLAGPSSMAFVILASSQFPEAKIEIFIALLIAWLITTTILVLSDYLRKILGNRVLRAIERLMGMILTTLAVQMLLSGIKDYFMPL